MENKYIKFLGCINSLEANKIENVLIIISLLSLIISIIEVFIIPWKITSLAMLILFIISLFFVIISAGMSMTIHYFRRKALLKNNRRIYFIYILIFLMFACFFLFVIHIFFAVGTIPDLNKTEKETIEEIIESTGETKYYFEKEKRLISKGRAIISMIIILLNIFLSLILIPFWVGEYIRLLYNISGAYNDYKEKLKENVKKHPIKYGLNLIGHNKDGFPIFGEVEGKNIKIISSGGSFDFNAKNKYSQKYIDDNGIINTRIYSKMKEKIESKEDLEKKGKEKEKYFEKYYDNKFDKEDIFQDYDNFSNITIINQDNINNSINPGYEV